ncbi:unnamed protein product [Periconia digitata]|uniref:Carbamoyltransferase n=1 Tax=Periconia digitata TaxID=1303443 RepID=A0A9W4XII7_9PLEO|nr:unnamed protein product [Periconia digitata]
MIGPRNPKLGKFVSTLWKPLAARRYARAGLFPLDSITGTKVCDQINQRVLSGETCYIVGLGISGHNAGASLVQVSLSDGIRLLSNDEEERFVGIKHYQHYPEQAIGELSRRLKLRGVRLDQVAAWATSWNYSASEVAVARIFAEEFPTSVVSLKPETWTMWNPFERCAEARRVPARLRDQLGLDAATPIIMPNHHMNHASFAYAASPFAKSERPVVITVLDGAGDRGAISLFRGENGSISEIFCNEALTESLGLFYSLVSSTHGGWTPLSSEGRYMGAVAWGDQNRLTNPYYRRMREIFHFSPSGRVYLNRGLANWPSMGELRPYTSAFEAIIGKPIPKDKMWNPDAVLNVDSIKHSEITRDRVDLAAATQLVFEDCVFHIVDYLIRSTGSDQLIMAGGTALNGLANMRLLEQFDREWYKRNLDQDTTLKLWVPPTPSDSGVSIGAAYSLALRSKVPCGPSLKHAAWCGIPAQTETIQTALEKDPEIEFHRLGNLKNDLERRAVADLMAFIVAQDGVLGLYQGAAETGPRALGQRSILANPCNPETRKVLNERVKFRETIRPLAPMVTREQADMFFELAEGAAADDYNAYYYMVLMAKARPLAFQKIPSVVHEDGTSRIQIVKPETNPLVHDYLQSMGKRLGAEVSVNTSLNVGGPICQTPTQALGVLRRAKGMTGLVFVSDEGEIFLAWNTVGTKFRDNGEKLKHWVARHNG